MLAVLAMLTVLSMLSVLPVKKRHIAPPNSDRNGQYSLSIKQLAC